MAKKKAALKKASKRSKVVKPRRAKSVKPQRPTKKPRKSKPPKPKRPKREYGPTIFLLAESETVQVFELDATPHPKTIQSYRLEEARIRQFEQPDGKILYKVTPLTPPVG
jgi:hypothetical protein